MDTTLMIKRMARPNPRMKRCDRIKKLCYCEKWALVAFLVKHSLTTANSIRGVNGLRRQRAAPSLPARITPKLTEGEEMGRRGL